MKRENEPLKDKAYYCCANKHYLHVRMDDLKSAVQGLLENLKEKQINARVYQSDELLDFYSGYEEGISDAIQEIKKWFPDIIEESNKDV